MPTNTLPIVGAFYRPPAKALIDVLPVGTPLYMIAEPDNQYDPNAIAIWLETENLPDAAQERLVELLPAYGLDLDTVMAQEAWHLGYVPREMAAKIKAAGMIDESAPYEVTFSTSASGAPRVRSIEAFDL
jgi:hypothetical protein